MNKHHFISLENLFVFFLSNREKEEEKKLITMSLSRRKDEAIYNDYIVTLCTTCTAAMDLLQQELRTFIPLRPPDFPPNFFIAFFAADLVDVLLLFFSYQVKITNKTRYID